MLDALYKSSLGLLTDLYQLTMSYGYWKAGMWDREAVFHLVFRRHPFQGGFTIAAGLATTIEHFEGLRFDEADTAYLATLPGNDGRPLFEPAFLDYLCDIKLTCDVDAMPEGTVVFPQEPLVRVTGPLLQAQLLETPLLNIINFQTLIATKAARVVLAARGEPVLEFGLRRAQGIDGALSASRAAYIGGCAATSNVLAGKLFGIPVRGTHAHSWVMCFDDELEAFRQYARIMPNNCLFLVDTYNTLEGVRRAVTVGRELRALGHEMAGIRLDSGDFAALSIAARRILDEGGFPKAVIVASNDLDERLIESLKTQGARINVWGVGTRLVTGHEEPALGGVYKLAAIRTRGRPWQYKMKLSEQTAKMSIPGVLQVRRYYDPPLPPGEGRGEGSKAGGREQGAWGTAPSSALHAPRSLPPHPNPLPEGEGTVSCAIGDAIFDEEHPPAVGPTIVDPLDMTRRTTFPDGARGEDLLVPVFRDGKRVYDPPCLEEIRRRVVQQLDLFHPGIKRFVNPHYYPVGLESGLHERTTRLILQARGTPP